MICRQICDDYSKEFCCSLVILAPISSVPIPAPAEGGIHGPVAEDAISVKSGVLAVGGIPVVYGNITAESQSARRTNDGDELLLGGKYAALFKCL